MSLLLQLSLALFASLSAQLSSGTAQEISPEDRAWLDEIPAETWSRWLAEPYCAPVGLAELLPERELPEERTAEYALVVIQLELESLGMLDIGLRDYGRMQATLASEPGNEELAVELAVRRVGLLGALGAEEEEVNEAFYSLYPNAAQVAAVLAEAGIEGEPRVGEAPDRTALETALVSNRKRLEAAGGFLRGDERGLALAAADPSVLPEGVWLSPILSATNYALLVERFGAPSRGIAMRVLAELVDGGSDHIARLGSVAVPSLALFAIAEGAELGALSPYSEPETLRLDPLLELARLDPSAAWELIAELSPRRGAEWRRGAVGAYLRAAEGNPLASVDNWIRTDSGERLLEPRMPERVAALAALLRDERVHASLGAELRVLLDLDAVPEEVGLALIDSLRELDGERALTLLETLDPAGRSLRSTIGVLRAAAEHRDSLVAGSALDRLAREGDWRAVLAVEPTARREELLNVALDRELRDHRLPDTSLKVGGGEYAGWQLYHPLGYRSKPVSWLEDADAETYAELFNAGDPERQYLLVNLLRGSPVSWDWAWLNALASVHDRVAGAAIDGMPSELVEEDMGGLELVRDAGLRESLYYRLIRVLGGRSERDPEYLARLPLPVPTPAHSNLRSWLDDNKDWPCEASLPIYRSLVGQASEVFDESWFVSCYANRIEPCGLDAEFLRAAAARGYDRLLDRMVSVALEHGQLAELGDLATAMAREQMPGAERLLQVGFKRVDQGRSEWAELAMGMLGAFDLPREEVVARLRELRGLEGERTRAAFVELVLRHGIRASEFPFGTTLGNFRQSGEWNTPGRPQVLQRLFAREGVDPQLLSSYFDWFHPRGGVDPGTVDLMLEYAQRHPGLLRESGEDVGWVLVDVARRSEPEVIVDILEWARGSFEGRIPSGPLMDLAELAPGSGAAFEIVVELLSGNIGPHFSEYDLSRAVGFVASNTDFATAEGILVRSLPRFGNESRATVSGALEALREGNALEQRGNQDNEAAERAAVREQVLALIESSEGNVRAQAVLTLGTVGELRDIPLLIGLCADTSTADEALADLRGRFGRPEER